MNINKRLLRKAHRYIGVISAIFILFLSSTGILLNHTDSLQLEKITLKNPSLLSWYGIKPPTITSMALNQHWISSDNHSLYIDSTHIAPCTQLINAQQYDEIIYIACQNSIILLTPSFELIETLDENSGLPTPIEAFAINATQLLVLAQKQYYSAAIDNLEFSDQAESSNMITPTLISPPKNIQTQINLLSNEYGINVERVLLDIHSGRILGTAGILLIDAAAIMLLLLAMSGLYIWLKR